MKLCRERENRQQRPRVEHGKYLCEDEVLLWKRLDLREDHNPITTIKLLTLICLQNVFPN